MKRFDSASSAMPSSARSSGAKASGLRLPMLHRGPAKRALLGMGYPVDDLAGLRDGAPLAVHARGDVFTPYPYQTEAVRAFSVAGHGVIVLPWCRQDDRRPACDRGAGDSYARADSNREAAGNGSASCARSPTCRPTTSRSTRAPAARRSADHHRDLLDDRRRGGNGPTGFTHFDRLAGEPWGLVIYDEVHLVPAPIFQLSAQLQARRRLGLTATLVREDGRQTDVFALIGPKRYEVAWRTLEHSGHIAAATCFEVRVAMTAERATAYALAEPREQPRIAANNPASSPR